MVEAYKWYGFAIKKQRSQLEQFHPEMRQPSLEQICLPIMLTIFEIICEQISRLILSMLWVLLECWRFWVRRLAGKSNGV
jgi:hypothetical protein